ncbi:MAG: tRNA epoxyqueuosine(34) reductase QueG [Ignavibacteriae bacterium]|nr:MAG: tRNA epoxyqueuosine(34) reductase QueG [Ignavibacteriota bacterium]
MNSEKIKKELIKKASNLGFELIGFSPYQILTEEIDRLEEWLKNNYHAGMSYMERNLDKRKNVREILSNCESILTLGMNYFVGENFNLRENEGKVSRYAWSRDYHYIIWEKLDELKIFINELDKKIDTISYVDTGPVMDQTWAEKSGLGWMGKNGVIINREIGSWFFIANILTNVKFESYNKSIKNYCGNCTACIDACPTKAIIAPKVIDANRCISYLTIENKGEISKEFKGKFDNWIFGCDICQDVCPWNIKFSKKTIEPQFYNIHNKTITFDEIEQLSNKLFKEKFNESPILRAKLKGLKRNADFLKEK